MKKFLFDPGTGGRWRDLGLLILRLGIAGLLIPHGWGKLQDFGERASSFPDPLGIGSELSMGLAIFAELFCALAVVLGLMGRLATIPPAITMAVAVLVVHAGASMDKKELALVYLAGFVALFFTGPGRYSIDSIIRTHRT